MRRRRRSWSGLHVLGGLVVGAVVLGAVGAAVRGELLIGQISRLPHDAKPPEGDSYKELAALAKALPADTCGGQSAASAERLQPWRDRPCMVPASVGGDELDQLARLWMSLGVSARAKYAAGDVAGGLDDALMLAEFRLRLSASTNLRACDELNQQLTATLRGGIYRADAATAKRVSRRLEQLLGSLPSPAEQARRAAPATVYRQLSAGTEASDSKQPERRRRHHDNLGRLLVAVVYPRLRIGLWPSVEERRATVAAHVEAFAKELEKPFDKQQPPDGAGRFGFLESLERTMLFTDATSARLLCAETALAAYHAENGRYPSRLDQLCPDYLVRVPADSFTDAPLKYRAEGRGYVCWSICPDGKDDGGQRPQRSDSLANDLYALMKEGYQGDLTVSPPAQ